MILIASGAYLQGDFASEVGLLPPSFLPIGSKRLYEYQAQLIKNNQIQGEDLYISVPESYQIDSFDQARINELGIQILKVPDGLSIGESLLYCWNSTAKHHGTLSLLHGDTLFLDGYFGDDDLISVHTNHGFYQRASLGKDMEGLERVRDIWSNDCDQVISGFFCFSNPLLFMKSLVEAKSDFIKGLVCYHKSCAMKITSEGSWLDFGHINSFYHSRTKMTTQRAFNELVIGLHVVSKTSATKSKKIYAEGAWFAQIPLPLKLYTPALLGLNKRDSDFSGANYQLEYLYLLPLSDLLVFSRLREDYWQIIYNAISTMLVEFGRYSPDCISQGMLDNVNKLYLGKTLERLSEFSKQTKFDVHLKKVGLVNDRCFSLVEIANESSQFIQPAQINDISIVHGDLCFSNLLFDNRAELIKCIDPRGINSDGELSLFGDRRYDLAKLYHSVIGLYDFVISGRYSLEILNDGHYNLNFSLNEKFYEEVAKCFRKTVLESSGYDEKEILAITIHLFLSMLPLHNDHPERQQAFIGNALRLFKILREVG